MVKALYVHIPFCSYKCPYCDFTSLVDPPLEREKYIELLLREARLYADLERGIETLYLGGGTPTLLEPSLIGYLLEGLDRVLDLSGVKEITVECNPETYGKEEFKRLRGLGVNRLSLGAQSFSEKGLRKLGRKHRVGDTLRAYMEARDAGFENVNIDLIYAYPGQRPEDVEVELEWIERLIPEHVSAYMLTPYPNTPLGVEVIGGTLDLPEEEKLTRIYEKLWKGLRDLGYSRYEISNWSKEGFECRHNLVYWSLEEFLGLGVSAWGFVKGKRYGNTRNILKYAEAVVRNRRPVESEVKLSERDLFEEFVMLRLRLKEGLPYEFESLIPPRLKGFFEKGEKGIGIREEHMLLSNEIIAEVLVYNSDRTLSEVRNGKDILR